MTAQKIALLRAVKAAIRQPYAWPGGYPLYVLMDDGEALSLAAARTEWSTIVWAVFHDDHSGWFPAAVDVNWEDGELYCAHTNERIESAYAEDNRGA